ncbi:phosphate ABC transporter permease subunit PstC [Carboxydochorda subterranea]|uniref:Phosphate transport system permease protein n=1 Tax=Carboxydichorda subterranea TaxID=3109565 RepID=A0ABZ1BVE7_9FIRM|nr:phosphate ABC transporter permease subunit PstC [Limnochorda sp. L945t]WRP16138.1 phosphate ABC transporter permease subunit PstC [Limnochorda sp. L945t]
MAQAVGSKGRFSDRLFRWLTQASAATIVAIVVAIGLSLLLASWPAIRAFGFSFLVNTHWDPVRRLFGGFPFLFGTLVTSAVALALAVPVSFGIAVFLAEYCPARFRQSLSFVVELLAAIPSIVYGLWGLFVLVPLIRDYVELPLGMRFGDFPLFSGPPYGLGMLAAGVVLAIMVTPTIAAISRDVLAAVPRSQHEAALALGATRWEAIRMAATGYARAGILGAVILGLGRALGETMAVTMVIGNRPQVTASLFDLGATMASVIANEFAEAVDDLYLSTLFEVGLMLFLLTFLLNLAARALVQRVARGVSTASGRL